MCGSYIKDKITILCFLLLSNGQFAGKTERKTGSLYLEHRFEKDMWNRSYKLLNLITMEIYAFP